MNTNDTIREQILTYFYERNTNATSRSGKRGSAARISDVKSELKQRYGLAQHHVISNLTYLIDRGWIKKVDESKSVTTARGTTIPSIVTFYEITADGIDKFEGESTFQAADRYPGINIEANGSVITLGDGNIVHVGNRKLFEQLTELKHDIATCTSLTEDQKLDLTIDLESLRDQLAKSSPDSRVVSVLWSSVEKAATAAGLAGSIVVIAPHIAHLI